MQSSRVLIIRDPAVVGRSLGHSDAESSREEAACTAIDPRRRRLVAAQYASEAALLIRWTADLLDRARAGRVPDVPLSCDDLADTSPEPAECLRHLVPMRTENVNTILPCSGPTFPRIRCYTVTDGYRTLDWELTDEENPRPARVTYSVMIST
jgi:hypothetical protein